jgi:hypothetical protein
VNEGDLEIATRGAGKRASVYYWKGATALIGKAHEIAAAEVPVTDDEVKALKAQLTERQVSVEEVVEALKRDYGAEKIAQLSRPDFESFRARFVGEAVRADVQKDVAG